MSSATEQIIVKICGITRLEDALFAVECGADMLGLNFYPKSKRYISPEAARVMIAQVRQVLGDRAPLMIGVFVNESALHMTALMDEVGLDYAQLSGDESPDELVAMGERGFKAVRPADLDEVKRDVGQFMVDDSGDTRAPSLLLDAYKAGEYGGTGHQAADPIALAVKAAVPRLMLAGGLTPENVTERIALVQPWGIDVASGVEAETPGLKDHTRMAGFIRQAKRWR